MNKYSNQQTCVNQSALRIDKWLWAVRIFKTRTLAAEACCGGKVKMDGQSVKPAKTIKEGDEIKIQKENQRLTVKVVKLIERRVGAPQAVECYMDITPAEDKLFNQQIKESYFVKREKGSGRPTKKERRDLDKWII